MKLMIGFLVLELQPSHMIVHPYIGHLAFNVVIYTSSSYTSSSKYVFPIWYPVGPLMFGPTSAMVSIIDFYFKGYCIKEKEFRNSFTHFLHAFNRKQAFYWFLLWWEHVGINSFWRYASSFSYTEALCQSAFNPSIRMLWGTTTLLMLLSIFFKNSTTFFYCLFHLSSFKISHNNFLNFIIRITLINFIEIFFI